MPREPEGLVELCTAIARVVERRARPEASEWLGRTLAAQAAGTSTRGDFHVAFSGAARRSGTQAIAPGDESGLAVAGPLGDDARALLAGRGLDELARAALLLAELCNAASDDRGELLAELFYRGDAREKQAVLRALPLLPDAARFVEIPVEACRSSVQTVFEAAAAESPYPAARFSDLAFHQMVLKALFTGCEVARIVGLARRVTPELVRMVSDYAAERRAAGRVVPEDCARIVALGRAHA